MNRRHLAALALLGWYLIAPPVVSDKQPHPGFWSMTMRHFLGGI